MAGSHRKSKFAVAGISPHIKDSERTLIMQAKNKKTTRAKKTERNKRRLDRRFGRGDYYNNDAPFVN